MTVEYHTSIAEVSGSSTIFSAASLFTIFAEIVSSRQLKSNSAILFNTTDVRELYPPAQPYSVGRATINSPCAGSMRLLFSLPERTHNSVNHEVFLCTCCFLYPRQIC